MILRCRIENVFLTLRSGTPKVSKSCTPLTDPKSVFSYGPPGFGFTGINEYNVYRYENVNMSPDL